MSYFFAEDKNISGKWIQLISRSMDIMDQSANQSVCLSLNDKLTSASKSVCTSIIYRQTDFYK